MMKVLFLSAVSVCLEIASDTPYYAPKPYRIYLNDSFVREGKTNVFSLFSLLPGQDYRVRLAWDDAEEELVIRTLTERCDLNVKDFGAKGDGVREDTLAIQTAINCLPKGARLRFPPGEYLTLPLTLKSHMVIDLAKGARLLAVPDRSSYPVIPGEAASSSGERIFFGGFEGNPGPMYQSLLTAQYAEDITILGEGCVDGNAQNSDFWKTYRQDPVARPRILFMNRCEGITLQGVTICNSPSWQLHPYYCDGVRIYDVTVKAPKDSPNTDACDPESCDHTEIIGCRFTVGDDCIAIKSGKIELGNRLNRPADHHTVRNCLMESGHGAITLGSEIGAGVRNLSVSQCLFLGTDRGLRIKTRRGRGKNCFIDSVSFRNIKMDGVLTPIVINMWYNCCDPDRESEYVWSRECLPVDERTPRLSCFRFSDIVCENAHVAACYIDGLPEMPLDEVEFENVRISFAKEAKPGVPAMQNFAKPMCKTGLYLDNVRHVRMKNVTISGQEGEWLITKHCDKLDVE